MIIKWTDKIISFDKHQFIHKEKQRGCPLLEDNLFVSPFVYFEIKLKIYFLQIKEEYCNR